MEVIVEACSICLEEFQAEVATTVPCSHMFWYQNLILIYLKTDLQFAMYATMD